MELEPELDLEDDFDTGLNAGVLGKDKFLTVTRTEDGPVLWRSRRNTASRGGPVQQEAFQKVLEGVSTGDPIREYLEGDRRHHRAAGLQWRKQD